MGIKPVLQWLLDQLILRLPVTIKPKIMETRTYSYTENHGSTKIVMRVGFYVNVLKNRM